MASSSPDEPESGTFAKERVGNSGFVTRHNRQMFEEGRSFSGNERDKLWFNRGDGTFADHSDLSGCDSPNDGRAAIGCDFDDDGDVDLFVHNIQRERHGLYRNELGRKGDGFLKLRLRATSGQYEAIGAIVTVDGPHGAVAQVSTRGAGFVSCQAPELVFGLGAAERAAVQVRWPGGAVESFGELARNSRALLVEGAGEAQLFAGEPRSLPDPRPAGLKVDVGDVVPVLYVLDREGKSALLDVRELAGGKPLYLNFWATYCPPCIKELPDLQELHEAGEVRVVALSMDAPGKLYAARDLLEGRGASYPGFYLGALTEEGLDGELVETIVDLQRLPLPTTLMLSPQGRIERIHRGPISK